MDNYLTINQFEGDFAFLNNDYLCEVYFEKKIFPSAEAAIYAAMFDLDISVKNRLQQQDCITSTIELIKSSNYVYKDKWMTNQEVILEQILRDKFLRNFELRSKLRDTMGRRLIWMNNEDSNLGVVNDVGFNLLGKILTVIRDDIIKTKDFDVWIEKCMNLTKNINLKPEVTVLEKKEDQIIKTIQLDKKQLYWFMGTYSDCDIISCNPSVNGQHSVIFVNNMTQIVIIDMRSKNGLYINKQKINMTYFPYIINPKTVVTLGNSSREYQFIIENSKVLKYLQKEKQSFDVDLM